MINLADFNIKVINNINSFLNIDTKILKTSDLELDCKLKKQDLIFEILKLTNAKKYISGMGAKTYQNEADFENAGFVLQYDNTSNKFQKESIVESILREGKWKIMEKMILV